MSHRCASASELFLTLISTIALGLQDNNIRYVALNTLARVVGVDTQASVLTAPRSC